MLTAGNPSALEGSVWIDLFAGTGAVGIEALSRGAATVYFVESSRAAAELIKTNLDALRVTGRFDIMRQEVRAAITALESQQLQPGFIFLDPPYAMKQAYGETLGLLANSKVAESALVIAEHERKFDPGEKFGSLHRTRRLEQSDSVLSFYRQQKS